jgi:hypothetical protein
MYWFGHCTETAIVTKLLWLNDKIYQQRKKSRGQYVCSSFKLDVCDVKKWGCERRQCAWLHDRQSLSVCVCVYVGGGYKTTNIHVYVCVSGCLGVWLCVCVCACVCLNETTGVVKVIVNFSWLAWQQRLPKSRRSHISEFNSFTHSSKPKLSGSISLVC